MSKLTKKNLKDLRFQYLNELINISKLQADVIQLIHIDGVRHSEVSGRLSISLDRVRYEEATGFKNLFYIAIGDKAQEFFSDGNDAKTPKPKAKQKTDTPAKK